MLRKMTMSEVLGRIGKRVYVLTDDGMVLSDGVTVGPLDEFMKFLGGYLEPVDSETT
jgi:hypothetical protein